MASKKQAPVIEPTPAAEKDTPVSISTTENTAYALPSPALQSLLDSDIVTIADGAIIWRAGHFAHVAFEYARDPQRTESLYADDLVVIRQYDNERFTGLVKEFQLALQAEG